MAIGRTTHHGVRQQGQPCPDEVVRHAEKLGAGSTSPPRRCGAASPTATPGPPRRIDAALANYFQPGTLITYCELALLWVADDVDVAVQRYRTEKNVSETWETRERVVVALTGDKESEAAPAPGGAHRQELRRCRPARRAHPARRRARGRPRRRDRAAAAPGRGGRGRQLPHRRRRPNHYFARGVNATQLVIGTSRRRSRLARRLADIANGNPVPDAALRDIDLWTG